MTDRPIIFSGPMVRAILEGRKTQTRRVIAHFDGSTYAKDPSYVRWQPPRDDIDGPKAWRDKWFAYPENSGASALPVYGLRCPYGVPGDRLWVRETGWQRPERSPRDMREGADTWPPYEYDAARVCTLSPDDMKTWGWKRRPAIHMPRWASRIKLEVTGVRVERLQEISEEDAKAEGCSPDDEIENALIDPMTGRANAEWAERAGSAKESFCNLWQRIHKRPHDEPTAWEENPWVWVIEFRRAA